MSCRPAVALRAVAVVLTVVASVLIVPVGTPSADARDSYLKLPTVGRTAHILVRYLNMYPDETLAVEVGPLATTTTPTVVPDPDGKAMVDLTVDGSWPGTTGATSVTLRVIQPSTGTVVKQLSYVPLLPRVSLDAVGSRNPATQKLMLAGFAQGERVDLAYGAGVTGPASIADVGDLGTTFAVSPQFTGAPIAARVTATGTVYGRTTSYDVTFRGDTLPVGQRLEYTSSPTPPLLVAAGGRWTFGVDGIGRHQVLAWEPGATVPVADRTACKFLACNQNLGSLVLQADGDLVRVQNDPNVPGGVRTVWSAGTAGTGTDNRLTIGSDGVLRLVTRTGLTVWDTRSGRIYRSSLGVGERLLAGDTLRGARGGLLQLQADGNLVYRTAKGVTVWSTGTSGTAPTLTMQKNGNLVLSASGRAAWISHTVQTNATFAVEADGNLVVRSPAGAALWSLWGLPTSPLPGRPTGI